METLNKINKLFVVHQSIWFASTGGQRPANEKSPFRGTVVATTPTHSCSTSARIHVHPLHFI